jgi:soluble lytic murein transglycosylase-like protein
MCRRRGTSPALLTRTSLVLLLGLGAQALATPLTPEGSGRRECGTGRREGAFDADIRSAIDEVAAIWPLSSSLIKAIIARESDFNPTALSSAGAIGLMQVLPSNARRLGLVPEALWSPRTNILAGARLLAVLLKHYRGDVISALVAYNARPRARLAPLPDNHETPAYVRAVLRLWDAYEKCGAGRVGASPARVPKPVPLSDPSDATSA